MRIRLHLTLMILAEFAAFFLGALAMWALLPRDARDELGLVMLAGSAVAASLAVSWVFRRFGARCPHCGKRAIPRGIRPICYCCVACGHIHETRVRSNW